MGIKSLLSLILAFTTGCTVSGSGSGAAPAAQVEVETPEVHSTAGGEAKNSNSAADKSTSKNPEKVTESKDIQGHWVSRRGVLGREEVVITENTISVFKDCDFKVIEATAPYRMDGDFLQVTDSGQKMSESLMFENKNCEVKLESGGYTVLRSQGQLILQPRDTTLPALSLTKMSALESTLMEKKYGHSSRAGSQQNNKAEIPAAKMNETPKENPVTVLKSPVSISKVMGLSCSSNSKSFTVDLQVSELCKDNCVQAGARFFDERGLQVFSFATAAIADSVMTLSFADGKKWTSDIRIGLGIENKKILSLKPFDVGLECEVLEAARAKSLFPKTRYFLCDDGAEYFLNGAEDDVFHSSAYYRPRQSLVNFWVSGLPIFDTHRATAMWYEDSRTKNNDPSFALYFPIKALDEGAEGKKFQFLFSNQRASIRTTSEADRQQLCTRLKFKSEEAVSKSKPTSPVKKSKG